MKSRANFPHGVYTSWLKRNISSYCASVSLDVARAGSTHTFVGCPLCWTIWHALDGATIPAEDTDAPVSTLALSSGRDPLFELRDGAQSEPVMGQCGAMGVNREREEGEDALVSSYAPTFARPPSLSPSLLCSFG